MVYHAKTDIILTIIMFLMVWIFGAISLLPFTSLSTVIIMSTAFIVSVVFVWWYANSIKFVFYDNYLLVKGGPFKSKIPYQSITMVSPTTDKYTGYLISSSDKGLEIFYSTAANGSIKILPKDKMQFILELKKRCPNAQISQNQQFE
ncbi:PH domain-containing protein [Lysinibacillus xylanilyticus]|uniref:PH domain-containing protein n=1 Tax=Lysinibacillus xylanilyticus TaxID=582475 RepID=A0ABT4EX57_9BACI|nr:PH domain-containing protein [Lysinibacillus xylanilyticus]MCY9549066.1 PH domain-containing protein [Lysinibacillus xylanilyticus]